MRNNIPDILNSFSNRLIEKRFTAQRKATYHSLPHDLEKGLKECLLKMGYDKLYSHQSEMFEQASQGQNIIITTGTASGKSLAFYLPVIQRIIKQPAKRALFIYPTKALAQDQQKNLQPFVDFFGAKILNIGVYDGDTPASQRKKIREEANIILTNPDMINSGFLPNHNQYGYPYIFANLCFVIIDELHAYRGAFGSHVSNVMKRLIRICKVHGNSPQFLCSSATISNPKELAENICHCNFLHISQDGSPASEKEIIFWQPPYIDSDKSIKLSVVREMVALIPRLVENHVRVIAFCLSRKETEVVTKECRDILAEKQGSFLSNKISGYRGGYTPEERRRIEKNLSDGALLAVISTNALELGIDIGSLELVLMGGFPGTRASFWQQLGRAGRRGEKAYAILMLNQKPVDQYIGLNPDWLLGASPENAVVDRDNICIQSSHVRAAAVEVPLTIDDIKYFPDLPEILALLQEIGEIEEIHGSFKWSGKNSPAHEISLRNITNQTIGVFDENNSRTITTMDLRQAKRELYPGAVYLHDSALYKCLRLDLNSRIAVVENHNLNYYTDPQIEKDFEIIATHEEKPVGITNVFFGDVHVRSMIPGYKMIQFSNHQNLGYECLEEPLQDQLDTEACWIQLPDRITSLLLEFQDDYRNDYFQGMVHGLKSVAEMTVMATSADIDGHHFSSSDGPEKIPSPSRALIVYDQYDGGLGFSEKIFRNLDGIIQNAIRLVRRCHCTHGCPVCVGNYKIDKRVILWAWENIFKTTSPPSDIKIMEDLAADTLQMPFSWDAISDRWADLIKLMQRNRVSGAEFLGTITEVSLDKNALILRVPQSTQKILENAQIKQSLINSLSQFVELPSDFELKFEGSIVSSNKRNSSKLMRRFKK